MNGWVNKPPIGTPLVQGHLHLRGLVGWWPLLEGAGGVARDYSKFGNDGTLTGMSFPPVSDSGWNPGQWGSVLHTPGSPITQYVGIPDSASLNPTGGITLSAWAFLRAVTGAGNEAILGKPAGAGWVAPYLQYLLRFSDEGFGKSVAMYLNIDGALEVVAWDVQLNTNQWYHIAGTFDGTTMAIYVDGIQHNTVSAPGTISVLSQPLCIADKSTTDAGDYLPGGVDDVRIYDRCLTPSEIQDVMHNPWAAFDDGIDVALLAQFGILPQMQQMNQFDGGAIR